VGSLLVETNGAANFDMGDAPALVVMREPGAPISAFAQDICGMAASRMLAGSRLSSVR